MATRKKEPLRAIILTALPDEYQAVRAHLKHLRENLHPEGTLYEQGRFQCKNRLWDVLIAEIGPHNDSASFEAERAIAYFGPAVALFVGVAGGIKDVSIGDVIASAKLYGYESGKAKLEFEPRPDVGVGSYSLEQRARLNTKNKEWLARIIGPRPSPSPKARVAPIAAGAKVVASTRSAVYRFLKHQYGDALAVEMEGKGFLTAARATHSVHALVVRGISDLIDKKSAADAIGSQELASRHAAAFAFELLSTFKPPKTAEQNSLPATSESPSAHPASGDFTHPTPSFFVGREGMLAELSQAIAHSRVIVVGGMPGIGKTHLCAQFLSTLPRPHHSLWIDCVAHSQLEQALQRVSEYLASHHGDPSLDNALRSIGLSEARRIEIASAALDKCRCVVVFDQFDQNLNSALLPLISSCSNTTKKARLILCANGPIQLADLFVPPYRLVIPPLEPEASIKLLRFYLTQLGLSDQSDALLLQAHNRVGGHPHSLKLLAVLSGQLPLEDLLHELPHLAEETHSYLRSRVFELLDPKVRELLANLSILRGPFRTQVTKHFGADDTNHFSALLNKYLITRQTKEGRYYEIHGLVRDFGITQLSPAQQKAAHKMALSYYLEEVPKALGEYSELIFHAIESDRLDIGEEYMHRVLQYLLQDGRHALALEFAQVHLKDPQISKWSFPHFVCGRIFRFRGERENALAAYTQAILCAQDPEMSGLAKFEAASVLADSSPGSIDWEKSKAYYSELLSGEEPVRTAAARGALGLLKALEGSIDEGIQEILAALNESKSHELPKVIADCHFSLGRIYEKTGKFEEAISQLETSFKILKEIEPTLGGQVIGAEYHTLAMLVGLYERTGRLGDAIRYNSRCVEIDRHLQNSSRLADSLARLGYEQCLISHFHEASEALTESKQLFEESGQSFPFFDWLAIALWNLGMHEKATEYVMRYIWLCENEGHDFEPIMMMSERSFTGNASDLATLRHRLLLIPSRHKDRVLKKWITQVARRHPELAQIGPMLLRKPG